MARLRGRSVRYSRLNISPDKIVPAMKGLLAMRKAGEIDRLPFLKAWSKLRRYLEATPQYADWRKKVIYRAGGACETCGEVGHECHHIEPLAWNPDRALDPDNGRLLCVSCHRRAPEHTHARRRARHYASPRTPEPRPAPPASPTRNSAPHPPRS